jgi:ATPase family protein associated with various cellular activities (AAA)/AAA lid domain-containing protein
VEDLLPEIVRACGTIAVPIGVKLQELHLRPNSSPPYFKSQKAVEYLQKRSPHELLETDLTGVMVRIIASDLPVKPATAKLFRQVLVGVNRDSIVSRFPIDSTLNYINKLVCSAKFRAYQQPLSLVLLNEYDATNHTDFSNRERCLLIRLAAAVASAAGPMSLKTRGELEQLEMSLRSTKIATEPVEVKSGSAGSTSSGKGSPSKPQVTVAETIQSGVSIETLLGELNRLTGLKEVKKDVADLTNYIRVQQLRRSKGLRSPDISLHMVFHGNPGTGKTTVARLLSRIYQALGVVSKGHLVETDRSDLVAGYVGQTALKVKAVCEKALGGILFIDEAYALKRSGDPQDFGNEAIETLLKFMEDNRQDFVVIVAGYPEEMNRFLDANPGLQSRFNKSLSFPDYSPEELMEIFLRLCDDSDYQLSDAARSKLSDCFRAAYENRNAKFGNARMVRNSFEKAIRNVANRVVQDEHADAGVFELIEATDITSFT